MNIIIECTNFKPSPALNVFIEEKAQGLIKLDAKVTRIEFKVSVASEAHTKAFSCGLNLNIPGNDVAVHAKAEDVHEAVHKAIDSAKRGLQKIKTKRLAARRKAVE